tara:strand:+ start:9199 stop:10143 length:945 start_codon:yes stop_codon:yes gene_type:complete
MELGSGGNVSTDELNIKELITDLWLSKFFIFSLSILVGIFSLIIAFSMPQKYLSEAILFPESDSSESLPSSLSFVETFTGQISNEISNKALAFEIFYSRDFFEIFYANDLFLAELMAFKSYKEKENFFYTDLFDLKNKNWIEAKPSFSDSFKEFHEALELKNLNSLIGGDSFVRITCMHQSPEIASKWLKQLILELNNYVRNLKVKKANNSIEFLSKKLSESKSIEIREAISLLIQENLKTVTLGNSSENFVFSYVDSPRTYLDEVYPIKTNFFFIGLFIGFFSSIILVLLIKNISNKRIRFFSKKRLIAFEDT